jgi:hypothetical protein
MLCGFSLRHCDFASTLPNGRVCSRKDAKREASQNQKSAGRIHPALFESKLLLDHIVD